MVPVILLSAILYENARLSVVPFGLGFMLYTLTIFLSVDTLNSFY